MTHTKRMTWDKAENKAEKLFGDKGFVQHNVDKTIFGVGKRGEKAFLVEAATFEKCFARITKLQARGLISW